MVETDEPVKRDATYADLMELPENVVGEIIDGHLYATPRPRIRHAQLATRLLTTLASNVVGRSAGGAGWWCLPEPELHFGKEVLVPDLAAWRRDRLPDLDGDAPWLEIAPDWVCEILSPSTARRDRTQKLPIYARVGVGHAWFVDPVARTLEVLRPSGETWILAANHGRDDRVRPEPFGAVEFDLDEWWMPGGADAPGR